MGTSTGTTDRPPTVAPSGPGAAGSAILRVARSTNVLGCLLHRLWMRMSLQTCVLAALALLALPTALALRVSDRKDTVAPISLTELTAFGFDEGGSVDMRWQVPTTATGPVTVLMCTEEEAVKLRTNSMDKLCNSTLPLPALQAVCPTAGSRVADWNADYTATQPPYADRLWKKDVKDAAFYSFQLLSCANESLTATFSWEMTNPGGNQLSSGAEPLPGMESLFVAVWAVLAAGWYFKIARVTGNRCHKWLTVVPLLHMLKTLTAVFFWNYISKDGTPSGAWGTLLIILDGTSLGATFGFALLVARGWHLLKKLKRRAVQEVFMLSLLLAVTSALALAVPQSSFFIILVIAGYFGFVFAIFWAVAETENSLDFKLGLIESLNLEPSASPSYQQLLAYKLLRGGIILFVIVDVLLVRLVGAIVMRTSPWVEAMFREGELLLLCVLVGWVAHTVEACVEYMTAEEEEEERQMEAALPDVDTSVPA
eukprot:PLAT4670.1.p1 GENE.PLAT4670.1~~PLAT4670.1.p1  ORF type:complete len:528 (+),score=187.04 PLAT4670.1:138-1586(+)